MSKKRRAKIPPFRVLNSENIFGKFVSKIMRSCDKNFAQLQKALTFLPKAEQKEAVKKSSQRSFQALRIDVNSEYEVLESFLESLPDILAPGGRVAILTFHSGEDRLVKKSFQRFYKEGIYEDIAKNVIRPSAEECNRNSRAHSTKMRWAIRK